MSRRTYSVEQYRADLARLDALRASSAPGLTATLAAAVIADAELVRASAPPESGVVQRRRDTAPGGFVAPPAARTIPATPAALRAAGLGPRPSARGDLRCHWLALALAIVAVVLGGMGCGVPPADGAPDFGQGAVAASAPASADLSVWAADTELWAWLQTVAPRIERATGLRVALAAAETSGPGDVPIFWSGRGEAEGWLGLCGGDWIALDPGTPTAIREAVVLHEVLHALGAAHVETGAGVLSPQLWLRDGGWPLTEADLVAVCAARNCPAFVPEIAGP